MRGQYKNWSTAFGGNDLYFIIRYGQVGIEIYMLSLVPIYIGRRVYINRCLKSLSFLIYQATIEVECVRWVKDQNQGLMMHKHLCVPALPFELARKRKIHIDIWTCITESIKSRKW